jgi:hypothetical protein
MRETRRVDSDDVPEADGAASTVIPGSEKRAAVGPWIGVVMMAAIALTTSWWMHLPLIVKPGIPNPIAAITGLLALFFLVRGGWETIRLRRFGDPALSLVCAPVPRGGKVEGRIELGSGLTTAPSFTLRLQCIHAYVENTGRNSHTVENVLWSGEEQATILPGGILPVSIAVPPDQPASRGGGLADRVLWRLTVMAPFRGIPFLEKYEIPVHGDAEAAVQSHRAFGSKSEDFSDDQLPDAAKQKRFTFIFMLIAGVVVAAFGCFLLTHAGQDIRMALASRDWPSTPGRIVDSQVGQSSVFGQPVITYQYSVNGTAHRGHVVCPHAFWSSATRRQMVSDWPVDREVQVRYSPAHPAEACLEPGVHLRVFQRLALAMMVLTFAALMIVAGAFAPRYGVTQGNTISFPAGSLPATIIGRLFFLLVAEAVAAWVVT